MKEIKFRAWHRKNKEFYNWGIGNIDDNGGLGTFPSDLTYLDHQQYTGLHDKNGMEIYEGDILSFEEYQDETIIFDQGAFGYGDRHFISLHQTNLSIAEVIGNIYENPELLS